MPRASISSWPKIRKNSRTPMLTTVARKAVTRRLPAVIEVVTAMKTGMERKESGLRYGIKSDAQLEFPTLSENQEVTNAIMQA